MVRLLSLVVTLTCLSGPLVADGMSLSFLRKIFHSAVLDADRIPSFAEEMDNIHNPTPIEMAYQAAAQALQAQEEWNPIEKLSHLRKFKRLMTRAVELDVDEIEIRFLRFGIEYNIPGIFGFSDDLYEDKVMIIDSVSRIEKFEVDQYFTVYILTLLADSGLCSPEEIAMVRSKIDTP